MLEPLDCKRSDLTFIEVSNFNLGKLLKIIFPRHGNLVNKGDKGVWIESLHTGKHPLNTKIMKVELVPTTNIAINFTTRFKGEHGYDSSLVTLKLLSFDGFTFELEVFQIIHVGAMDAPKVISRLGSMQNLIDQVLRPIVGNYFRNSAQEYTILDFLTARSERQAEAAEYVRQALRAYDVQRYNSFKRSLSFLFALLFVRRSHIILRKAKTLTYPYAVESARLREKLRGSVAMGERNSLALIA